MHRASLVFLCVPTFENQEELYSGVLLFFHPKLSTTINNRNIIKKINTFQTSFERNKIFQEVVAVLRKTGFKFSTFNSLSSFSRCNNFYRDTYFNLIFRLEKLKFTKKNYIFGCIMTLRFLGYKHFPKET